MQKLKAIHPSWVLNIDTDEFLIYNYIHHDEDSTAILADMDMYRTMMIRECNCMKPA